MLSVVCLFGLAGCAKEDEITKETVTHADREPIRLRIAIMEKGELVWFFRLSGPVELVKANEPVFEEFVKSVRFDGENDPTWTAPKDWKKDPQGKDRFAGYRIDAKPKELEVAVTRFPADKFKMMENMHRWQKQVNVPLTETHDELEGLVKREKIAGQEVAWVQLQGLGVHTVSKPPEPMAAHKKNFLPALPLKKPAGGVGGPGGGGNIPFKYTAPAGWVKKPARQFILDAYEISDGKNTGELTLSSLGGTPGSNINRWRGQIGLPEISDAEALRKADEQVVGGLKAYLVDLANPNGPPGKNRILGAVIPMGQQSWFIKFTGPLDLLEQRKGEFDAFVKSFKLEK